MMNTSTSPESKRAGPAAWGPMLASLAIVLGSMIVQFRGADFQRAIEVDELITLENYTWAGIHADGTRRPLGLQADVDDLEKQEGSLIKRLVLGVYCSLGRWTEPNNHVPYSLLVDASLLAPAKTVTALRLPALLASGGFALLAAWAATRFQMPWGAPAVAFLAAWTPYCNGFAQTGRGYTLMMLLCVALVLLLHRHVSSRSSLFWQMILAGVAFLAIANVVNLSVDFVLPALCLAWAVPSMFVSEPLDVETIRDRRRSLAAIIAAVGALGGVFLIDRLPYVVSSARQYGMPLSSPAEIGRFLESARAELFSPPAWAGVLALGLIGSILGLRDRRTRPLFAAWLAAFVLTLLHFAVARKAGYARNLGYLLPPLFFGYAYLVQRAATMKIGSLRIPCVLACYALPVAAACTAHASLVDPEFETLLTRLAAASYSTNADVILLKGDGVAETITLAVPDQSVDSRLRPNVELVIVERTARPLRLAGERQPENADFSQRWCGDAVEEVGPYRISRCRFAATRAAKDLPSDALFLWRPELDAVTVSPEPVERALAEVGLVYAPLFARYQAKLDVFGRLSCVVVDLSDSTSKPDQPSAAERFRQLRQEFGGDLYALER